MVSSPGGPPYSPPSPETLHLVITETLSDFPNKSVQEKVNCLGDINQLLLPLLKHDPTDGKNAIVAHGRGELEISGDGKQEAGISNDGMTKREQERKASVVSQMSEKIKGVLQLNGKKTSHESKEKSSQGTLAQGQGDTSIGQEEGKSRSHMPFRSTRLLEGVSSHNDHVPLATAVFTPPPNVNILKPTSEQEVVNIVKKAYRDNAIIRVLGSGHSVSPAIYHEEIAAGQPQGHPTRPVTLISLTKMRKITLDNSNKNDVKVTVEGGCNIGVDPESPDSTLDNSLVYVLNKAGYALRDLAGITHQTVPGFIMTGSSGGTVKASFLDAIYGLRLVDGTGKIRVLTRADSDPSEFFAAGISMGLFGVITSIILKVQPTFFITGTQTTSSLSQLNTDPSKGSPIDLLGPGTKDIPSMQRFLETSEFARCLWWPQSDLNRLTVWQARSISPINPQSGEQWTIEPYEELPHIGGSSTLAQVAARTVLIGLNLLESDNPVYKKIAATLLGFFNPLTEQGKPDVFTDVWFNGLAMDNEISDIIFPVSFSELWFPISDAQLILNDLHDLFTSEFSAIGNFTTEIYAAKQSPFWLSPSFEGDMVRVNVYFFSANVKGSPEDFFARYWKWFNERGRIYRCHWGKYLPEEFGKVVGQRYRMHGEWLRVRERMDPKQIFVTPYWQTQLAIPPPVSTTIISKVIDKLKDILSSSEKVVPKPITDQVKKSSMLKKLFSRCFCGE